MASWNPDPKPYPKAKQLARGQRRYRRKVAGPKRWAAIIDAKGGPCRVCGQVESNGRYHGAIQMHHVVPRGAPWFGDDTEDNIAPLCLKCHRDVTFRDRGTCIVFVIALTDAEYAYAVTKAGEDFFERYYGIVYQR